MIEILPAIIPQTLEDLKDKMFLVNTLVRVVQIDVCDGKFVPSKCWPYINDEEGDFHKIINESEEFPFWQSLDFEADLMVQDPENSAEDWIKAGAKRIVLHLESSKNLFPFIKELRKKYGYVGESAVSVEIGIAINIFTPNASLYEYLDPGTEGLSLIDFVQFMGIKRIGYQGESFDRGVLEKISDLREKYPDTIISVDGGVNFEDAHDLAAAGANRLISGSTVYESENIKEAIEALKNS